MMSMSGKQERKLYRREWSESDNPLVQEARAQTLAIQQLQVWLRLCYAILAGLVLLGYWGFAEGGGLVAGIVGASLGVVVFIIVMVLRVGIDHGRRNVNAMLDELQASS